MISATVIVGMQDRMTRAWHERADAKPDSAPPAHFEGTPEEIKMQQDWLELATRQHRANFDL